MIIISRYISLTKMSDALIPDVMKTILEYGIVNHIVIFFLNLWVIYYLTAFGVIFT